MDTKSDSNLNWPNDLFRDTPRADVLDDPDNPFWESSDLDQGTKPAADSERSPCRECAMAA